MLHGQIQKLVDGTPTLDRFDRAVGLQGEGGAEGCFARPPLELGDGPAVVGMHDAIERRALPSYFSGQWRHIAILHLREAIAHGSAPHADFSD